jgi:copper chaperone CopZ
MQIRINVSGMTCGGCKAAVERVLGAQPGVSGVSVDLAAGSAIVDAGDEVAAEALVHAVENAGYEARLAS